MNVEATLATVDEEHIDAMDVEPCAIVNVGQAGHHKVEHAALIEQRQCEVAIRVYVELQSVKCTPAV